MLALGLPLPKAGSISCHSFCQWGMVEGRGQVLRDGDLLEQLQVRLGVGDYVFKHLSHQVVHIAWKKIVNIYIMSSTLYNFICLSYIVINSLCFSYLQCVGVDFTGLTVCPPFLAFGKFNLYLSFPDVVLA